MKLSDDAENAIESPTEEDVRRVIEALTPEREGFAILEESEQCFMQAAGDTEEGFVLEHREGSAENHKGVYGEVLGSDEVVTALLEYSKGEMGFKGRYDWENTF